MNKKNNEKIMKKIFSVILLITMLSCSNSDNETSNSNSPYAGTWTGTYTGTGGTNNTGDNGTCTVMVSNNGTVTGTATSVPYSETYQLTGSVNASGVLAVAFGTSSAGGVFNGNMSTNGTASGTWTNNIPTPPFTGTWNATKQ